MSASKKSTTTNRPGVLSATAFSASNPNRRVNMTFTSISEELSSIFNALQTHAEEYKIFHEEGIETAPFLDVAVGVFKVNGNGEIRVALDLQELRRAKMANFRTTFNQAEVLMEEAEKLMNETLGANPTPAPVNKEFQKRLEDAVEVGIFQKGVKA